VPGLVFFGIVEITEISGIATRSGKVYVTARIPTVEVERAITVIAFLATHTCIMALEVVAVDLAMLHLMQTY